MRGRNATISTLKKHSLAKRSLSQMKMRISLIHRDLVMKKTTRLEIFLVDLRKKSNKKRKRMRNKTSLRKRLPKLLPFLPARWLNSERSKAKKRGKKKDVYYKHVSQLEAICFVYILWSEKTFKAYVHTQCWCGRETNKCIWFALLRWKTKNEYKVIRK